MAPIPKNAKVTFESPVESGRKPIPKGAKISYEGPTPEEAALMPVPEPTKLERMAEYIRNTPKRVSDSLTNPQFSQSFAGGQSMGVVPYLSAAIDTAPTALRALAGNPGDVSGTYSRALQRIQGGYDAAEKAEPLANIAGQAAAPNIAGKATAGRRVLSAGLNAATTAATHDGSAAEGGAFGVGAQLAAEATPMALRPIAKGLRNAAGTKAVQSMGTRAGITDRLAKMGISPEDVPELGNRFLDEGLVPSGLNPLTAPIDGAAKRTAALKRAAGDRVGSAISKADASGASFDPLAAQASMRSKMDLSNPLEAANASKATGLVEQVGELAPQGEYAAANSFAQANRMKSQAWEGADFRTDPKIAAKQYKRAVGGFRDSIAEQVEGATSPEVAASLRQGNSQYGLASKADDLLGNAASRDLQKQPFGPMKHAVAAAMGGGGVMATGAGGISAAIAPYVTEAIVTRGPAIAAHSYRGASRAAGAVGKVANQSPAGSAAAGGILEDYLKPKEDEEREADGASWLTGQ
jgi:hypothetical protein